MPKTYDRKCKQCGKPFVATHALATICSDKCKLDRKRLLNLSRPKSPKRYPRNCGRCGTEFIATHHNKKLCSEECVNANRKENVARHDAKPETKARNKAWHASPKAKAAQKAFRATEGRKEWQRAYEATPERKAWRKAYEASPKRKARTRTPEYKARAKAYREEHAMRKPSSEDRRKLPHIMYLVRFTQESETYIKVGLTSQKMKYRFTTDVNQGRMNNLEILDTITFKDFETCNIAESIIHDATLDSHITPVIAFGGSVNECRRPEALEQILSMFDSARAGMDNN